MKLESPGNILAEWHLGPQEPWFSKQSLSLSSRHVMNPSSMYPWVPAQGPNQVHKQSLIILCQFIYKIMETLRRCWKRLQQGCQPGAIPKSSEGSA